VIRTAIARAVLREDLPPELARASMEQILDGDATPAQIGALAVALRMKGETPAEIASMAAAMRARVPPIRTKRTPLLDTCGTGGDSAGTFNISTTSAIVAASCGVAVAKHGNRAVSSRTGSADVLESLGVGLDLTPESAARSLDLLGITFLFAPNYHAALRHAARPRREIGVRTILDLLGPLTNPAGARRQLVGVFSDRLVRRIAEALKFLGSERAWVVHGLDGLDELTVLGRSHVAELDHGEIREFELDPAPLGLAHTERGELEGGDAAANAAKIRAVLAGEKGAARDIVVLNAGGALVVAGVVTDLAEGVAQAQDAIDSGRAAGKLCTRCGAVLTEGAAFCGVCGAPVATGSFATPAPPAILGPGPDPPTAPRMAHASLEYGGFWRRFGSYLIDRFLLGVLLLPLGFAILLPRMASESVGWTDTDLPAEAINGLLGAVFLIAFTGLLASWLYYALLQSSSRQASLGQMALGIRVTDLEGRRVSFARASGRYFATAITSFTLGIGYLVMLFTARKQTLHDLIAGTLVLR
jgi:anthranilate phosphoribosyltransferase